MSQKKVSAPQSGMHQQGPSVDLGPELDIVRFAVGNDFRSKPLLGLSVKARSNVYGKRSARHPDASELPAGLSVVWFPKAGLFRFRRIRKDEAAGVEPVFVLEDKWLNDSTDQLLWWETPSLTVPATLTQTSEPSAS